MNTPSNQTPCTVSVITGFAYALQHVSKFIEFKTSGVKRAYLFSYEAQLKEKYLGNLISLVLDNPTSLKEDAWFRLVAGQYIQDPIGKRNRFFSMCPEYFSIEKTTLPEETFEYSFLSKKGIVLGKEVYNDHFDFFKRLVEKVWLRQTSGNVDASCGIMFTTGE